MSDPRPSIVCVAPVKNEAWILDRFIQAASTWADAIVIADQMSTDGSRSIAAKYRNVTVVDNELSAFDDGANRRLLIEAARRVVPEPRVFISLDADEALTADGPDTEDWRRMLHAAPGTVIRMQWVNVMPDEPRGWIPPEPIVFGFVDDGSSYSGPRIHPTRLPTPPRAPTLDLADVKVLHFQYLDSERMRAKQRWYQVWELLEQPERHPIQIYRRYHHMDAVDSRHRHSLAASWFANYEAKDIHLLAVRAMSAYPGDERVLDLAKHADRRQLRRVDIWDVDWRAKAAALDRPLPAALQADPRTRLDRRVFDWLARTQFRASSPRVRWAQRALRLLGW